MNYLTAAEREMLEKHMKNGNSVGRIVVFILTLVFGTILFFAGRNYIIQFSNTHIMEKVFGAFPLFFLFIAVIVCLRLFIKTFKYEKFTTSDFEIYRGQIIKHYYETHKYGHGTDKRQVINDYVDIMFDDGNIVTKVGGPFGDEHVGKQITVAKHRSEDYVYGIMCSINFCSKISDPFSEERE